jgi:peroxiredoxin
MVRTPSTMLPLGTPAPDFALTDAITGGTVRRRDFAGTPLLVQFICNHCPFVIYLQQGLADFARDYRSRGLAIVGINSNDAEAYPEDAPAAMATMAIQTGWDFPYLVDAEQTVAKAYRAACTPDFFLFDAEHRLVYRGQFDDSRPKGISTAAVTGADLRAAADAVLAGQVPSSTQKASLGCNIKWKPGNEPAWFQ